MNKKQNRSKLKKLTSWIVSFVMIVALGISISKGVFIKAVELGTVGTNTVATQEGCAIKIETTEKVSWTLPRQPIDLVILQDTSGSFRNTIHYVQEALKQLTTPVKAEEYDERNPRLVFTGNEATTDRVMVNTFQGVDGTNYYDAPYTEYDYWGRLITTYPSDSNFTVPSGTRRQSDPNLVYQFKDSPLMSSKEEIDSYINAFRPDGGTPTVPAIDETIAKYNAIKGNMGNRKTVFLLVTDGVANGVRRNGEVVIERSRYREYALQRYFEQQGVEEASQYLPEASQDYLSRARELVEAGNKLRALVKSDDGNTQNDGAVVVGFWEQVSDFTKASQYGTTYLRGFANTGVNTGDTRTVQQVFHQALRSVASSDEYYVNEQSDPKAFADKILKSVAQALVKEDVQGEFTVTEGYTVKSVTINKKKIVDVVKDSTKEIRGTIKQAGQNVTISVPEGVFNPGDNSFDYELSRIEDPETLSEEEEEEPSDDYAPSKKNVTVGQLTGTFKVGKYETTTIGSKTPTNVEVTDLKYCYPSATKDVKDTDISNDLGTVDDPIIKNKKSYAANLTTDSELFTYKVLYRMNNAPLEFKKNAMLVDRLDYRVEYKNGYVTDVNGNRLDNFTVQTKDVVDEVTGQMQTVVYAAIPEDPGVNTEYVKEGQYGNHKFKRYYLVIEAKLKDAYSFGKNPDEYKKILQENDGLGLMNQANIIWNGSGEPVDPTAQTRRSNTVYVLPPVQTDIKKDVQSVDGTGEGYVKDQDQLYLGTRSQEYYYNVESAWPGLADSYTLTDTLVPELEFVTTYGNKGAKITVNGNEVKALTDKLTFDGNTVTLKLTKADFTARAISRQITTANRGNKGPAVIKLTIKAKIKDKADLTKYVVNGQIKVPNKATVELNGKPQTSNTVYVTPDEPAPSKKINSTLDVLHTTKSSEAFEFNIQTKLPRDIKSYKSYKITDKLDSRLELTNSPAPYVKEPYAQHFDVTHDAATNTVTATAKATSLSTLTGGEMVELVIPAKIKDGTPVEEIPNTSKIVYETPTSGGEKETPPTPPVVVTPPPLIEKQVNAKQHADLTKRDEVFEYTIKSSVPKGAETFEITDELDEALEFAGNQGDVVVKIADTAVTDKVTITRSERNLGIKFTKEQLTADAGKAIVITFKAKIRGDVNLSVDKYTQDGTIKVPNKAKYTLNNNPKESNTVTVTPPTPTPPTVEKKVNDKVHETLGQRNQTFDYSIATQVPTDAKSFVITDELKEVLEFAGNDGKGEVVVKIGDAIVTNTTDVKTENQTLTVSLTADQLAKLQGQKVLVTFKAKIRASVNLTGYLVEGSDTIKVPNTASISVDNNPKVNSQPVTVTPPTPTPPTVEKKVNNKEHEALGQRDQMFEYSIETQVPTDAKSFVITDELKEVLEFAGNDGKGNVTVKIGEADVTKDTKVTVANQILTVSLTADQLAKHQGQKVLVTFRAKIRANVNLIAYLEKASNTIKVPNTASIRVDNNPKVDSQPVTVTPPTPDTPTIVKKVNNKDHEDLTKRDEEFEYTIQTQVPTDAKSFVITDELKEVLEFVGKDGKNGVTVKIGETDVTNNTTVKIENRTLTVSLTDNQLAKYQGQKVLVTFKAKIVANADLTAYTANGTTKVPNTANFVINNDFTTKKETEPVTVTPPGETPTPKKTVNDKQAEKLSNLDEVFTYKVTAEVPKNIAGFTKFELSDDLEDILTITETGVTVGDATLDKGMTVTSPKDANADSGKVTAALPTNEISKYAGKTVVLTIKARIKEGVQSFELAKYITADNQEGSIPNKATLTVGDKPDQKKDSNNVPVTPPSEDPTVTKKINDKLEHLDTETATNYTYNIKTKLPADITTYKKFVISDELDAELAVQGKPVISGPAAQFFDVKVEGQLVTATMKNFVTAQELAGKEVELVIVSQIRKGVTTQNIPNIARITYQNRTHAAGTPDSKKDTPPVTVTPPGETPTVEKKINKDLTEATVLPESNYTYNITSLLPVDITRYKAYAIVDELDENLAIQGTPVMAKIDGVDMTQFFDVKVAGQKVTATMKNFENAKDLAGKKVELVITAQVKSTSKAPKIDNTAKVTYQNKSHVDGTPDSETPPTPPVTVTPPPVTKKINETLDHLDTATKTNYNYNIKTVLPSDIASYKTFVINDDLDKDLEVQGTPIIKGDAAKFFKVTVDGQKVRATITDFNAAKAYAGKEVELVIVSQIREGVTRQAIPNQTTITYTNKVKAGGEPGDTTTTPPTPPVTVTPPGEDPTVEKKINNTLDHLDVDTEKDYTYNITTALPVDITSYKKFAIVDVLDKDLAVQGTPTITGEVAKFFDVKVDGQTVTATMKDFKNAKDLAGKKVELVIVSQVREGVTRQAIPNTAKVTYQNKSHVDGTPDSETPPTPPVTVTPPGEDPTVEKKINNTLDHLDVDTEKDYTYNITTTLPVDITSYKKFAIVDVLDKDLAVQGTPTITGEAAKFFDVKVDGQTVTATMKDFKNAKDLAGKKVELVIVSQVREGVTRQAIPNTAKVTYQNKSHVDGTPDSETPPTPPVTVTPPGEDPTVEKKINNTLDHLDVDTEKDYTYNITTTLPVDITSYKKFAIVDVLDKDLAVQGTPTITGEAAKFFDVKVDGQTVTATMKDFKNAKDLAGKKVELVIVSQVREGVTRQAIPNTAKVEFTNKAGQVGEKETKPVTVTPPTPNTPPIEKKVNGAESADLASRQEVFTYTIDTIVPTGAFAFEVSDTLKDVLTFEGAVTATLSGKSIAQSQISIDGQTVTVKLTKQQVREQAGKPLHIEFSAKVKDGVDLTPYMTNGKTSIPNTANYIVNNDPATKKDSNTVPVYPPTPNEPGIDKKINRDLTHLNVEVNKSYMYNVTANLPQDIATYREFVITDTLESVLAINGDVVAYVDGYATDAVKVTVEGNRVVATVVDFAKLAGFKQIQLYIPAYIKSDADLTAYVTNNVASIPNTASLEFTDSNGVKKRKDTTPVTVTPPTPDIPPTPPVNPPQPGTPVKTVSRVEGLEQTNYLALLQATESFRFDIKSVVPTDEAEDRRLNLTSITITDQLDPLFTVDKAKVAVKLTNAPTSNANYIDEDVEKAQAELDAEKAKLEEIKKSSQTEASAAALSEAQKVVARLETELAEAQAKLTELKTSATSATTESSSSTEVSAANPVDVIATDHSSEIAAQEVVIAELQAKLEAAKQRVQAAQEVLAKAKTPSEVKVEADNQEKVVAAKQKVLDEAKEKQAKVQERVEQFAKVNDKGELTAEAIAALGGTIKVDGQFVTVDFTDEYTMEALKGYTVNVIIYSSITDVNALTIDHFTKGIDNTATVQFNHDPSDNLTKKTNKVTVVPPKNETPPPPATPDKPKGDLPTPPTPPTEPTPPPSSGPILPKTGTNENGVYAIVGIILGALTFVLRKRKDNDSL
ncbi:isopeptide-forming domain-containing fimbrial protein [Streptococcus ruminantium]|nr:isopeptide-forming domain-containing fimbrial protein [Streptococcus ruminantium]MDQ8759275.1 isopeptide-forming domain-containing fimbrial protein [Streptococcus ruminantium]MDQ8793340.1 isopeptide-forming domain-containing fimbrial protein [Streptococcus ruminantium]MDQ8795932.1 isopeptide-forming domain-containing fimbrial protein [Streptococcus ruminantium]MDQ8816425.1 isopeptide-forming domain-containing fimbrial protein [Streptococcus ruminantium]MDQ8818079.1 isopeptide-forming domain